MYFEIITQAEYKCTHAQSVKLEQIQKYTNQSVYVKVKKWHL